MIKVASYCRVSTDKADQINSYEAQQRYFREYIKHHSDWELYEIYADEGITGTSTQKRTQFNRMIADAYDGRFQLIVTKEVSRFSRNILDTIVYTRELKAIGVGVLFLLDGINTMNPDAELYLSIMASVAQEESRKTSSRVVWGQTRQMEKGVVFGRSLLGYDVKDGKLTINPEGAKIVRMIFQKYAMEQVSTSEIAAFLSGNGYSTYRGNTQWKSNAIVKILSNEKYVGDLVQKKTYTPNYLTHEKRRNTGEVPLIRLTNHHAPIISREIWDMAQERLQKNNKHTGIPEGHSNRYIFSGKMKCGTCGASFVGRIRYLKDGTKIRRWSCGTTVAKGRASCDIGKHVRDDDAVQMLKTAVNNLQIDTNSIIRNVTALALNAIQAENQETNENPNHLQTEVNRILKKKEIMMDSFFSGDIRKSEMLLMKQHYDGKLESLYARIEKNRQGQKESGELRTAVQTEIKMILSGQTESEVFYKTLLNSLTVFKDRHMELRLKDLPQIFHFIESFATYDI